MLFVGPNNNALHRNGLVRHYSIERGKICAGIKILGHPEMLFGFHHIFHTVKSVDTQTVIIQIPCQKIPSFLKHLQAVRLSGKRVKGAMYKTSVC